MICCAILISYVLISAPEVSARGRMMEPAQRSSLWTRGFDSPRNDDDTGLNCGGPWVQHGMNGGQCGVCGDRVDAITRDNEPGGKYANGIIANTYTTNDSSVLVVIDLQSYLGGYFEFRICPNNNAQVAVQQSCLDRHQLRVWDLQSNKEPGYRYYPKGIGLQRLRVEIPKGMICTQCVLQWKWHTANDWGRCTDGTQKLGCGPQEEYINCADIAIEPVTGYNVYLNEADIAQPSDLKSFLSQGSVSNGIDYESGIPISFLPTDAQLRAGGIGPVMPKFDFFDPSAMAASSTKMPLPTSPTTTTTTTSTTTQTLPLIDIREQTTQKSARKSAVVLEFNGGNGAPSTTMQTGTTNFVQGTEAATSVVPDVSSKLPNDVTTYTINADTTAHNGDIPNIITNANPQPTQAGITIDLGTSTTADIGTTVQETNTLNMDSQSTTSGVGMTTSGNAQSPSAGLAETTTETKTTNAGGIAISTLGMGGVSVTVGMGTAEVTPTQSSPLTSTDIQQTSTGIVPSSSTTIKVDQTSTAAEPQSSSSSSAKTTQSAETTTPSTPSTTMKRLAPPPPLMRSLFRPSDVVEFPSPVPLSRVRRQAKIPPPPPADKAQGPKYVPPPEPSASSSKPVQQRTITFGNLIGDSFNRGSSSSVTQKQFMSPADFSSQSSVAVSGEALGEPAVPVAAANTGASSARYDPVTPDATRYPDMGAASAMGAEIGIGAGTANEAMFMDPAAPSGGSGLGAGEPTVPYKQPNIPRPPKQSAAELQAAIAVAPVISSAVSDTGMLTDPSSLVGASYIPELNEGQSNQAETSTAARHGTMIVPVDGTQNNKPSGANQEYLSPSLGTSMVDSRANTQAEIRSATMNMGRFGYQPTAEQILSGQTGMTHSTEALDTTNLEPTGNAPPGGSNLAPGILSSILAGGTNTVTDAQLDPSVQKTREDLIRQLGEAMGVIGPGGSDKANTGTTTTVTKVTVQTKSPAGSPINSMTQTSSLLQSSQKAGAKQVTTTLQDAMTSSSTSSQTSINNFDFTAGSASGGTSATSAVGSAPSGTNINIGANAQMTGADLGLTGLDMMSLPPTGMSGMTMEELMTSINMGQNAGIGPGFGSNDALGIGQQTMGSLSQTSSIGGQQPAVNAQSQTATDVNQATTNTQVNTNVNVGPQSQMFDYTGGNMQQSVAAQTTNIANTGSKSTIDSTATTNTVSGAAQAATEMQNPTPGMDFLGIPGVTMEEMMSVLNMGNNPIITPGMTQNTGSATGSATSQTSTTSSAQANTVQTTNSNNPPKQSNTNNVGMGTQGQNTVQDKTSVGLDQTISKQTADMSGMNNVMQVSVGSYGAQSQVSQGNQQVNTNQVVTKSQSASSTSASMTDIGNMGAGSNQAQTASSGMSQVAGRNVAIDASSSNVNTMDPMFAGFDPNMAFDQTMFDIAMTGNTGLGAGNMDLGAGNTGLGAGNMNLGAGNTGLGARNTGLGAGNMNLGTGNTGLGAGNTGLGAGNMDLGAGNTGVGAGDMNLGAGNTGLGAGIMNIEAGNTGLGAGNMDLGAGNTGLGAGNMYLRAGNTGLGTGSDGLSAGSQTNAMGSTTAAQGASTPKANANQKAEAELNAIASGTGTNSATSGVSTVGQTTLGLSAADTTQVNMGMTDMSSLNQQYMATGPTGTGMSGSTQSQQNVDAMMANMDMTNFQAAMQHGGVDMSMMGNTGMDTLNFQQNLQTGAMGASMAGADAIGTASQAQSQTASGGLMGNMDMNYQSNQQMAAGMSAMENTATTPQQPQQTSTTGAGNMGTLNYQQTAQTGAASTNYASNEATISLADLLGGRLTPQAAGTAQSDQTVYDTQSSPAVSSVSEVTVQSSSATASNTGTSSPQSSQGFTPLGKVGSESEFGWATAAPEEEWIWDSNQQRWMLNTNTAKAAPATSSSSVTASKAQPSAQGMFGVNSYTNNQAAAASVVDSLPAGSVQSTNVVNPQPVSLSSGATSTIGGTEYSALSSSSSVLSQQDLSMANQASQTIVDAKSTRSQTDISGIVPIATSNVNQPIVDTQTSSSSVTYHQTAVDPQQKTITEQVSASTATVDPAPTISTLASNTSIKQTVASQRVGGGAATFKPVPTTVSTVKTTTAATTTTTTRKPVYQPSAAELQAQREFEILLAQERRELQRLQEQKAEQERQLRLEKQRLEYERRQLTVRKQQIEIEKQRREQEKQRMLVEKQKRDFEQQQLLIKQKKAEDKRLFLLRQKQEQQRQLRLQQQRQLELKKLQIQKQQRLLLLQKQKQEQLLLQKQKEQEQQRLLLQQQKEELQMQQQQANQSQIATSNTTAVNQTDQSSAPSFTPIGAVGGYDPTSGQSADVATLAAWQAVYRAAQAQSEINATASGATGATAQQTAAQNPATPQILNPTWMGMFPQQQAAAHGVVPAAVPAVQPQPQIPAVNQVAAAQRQTNPWFTPQQAVQSAVQPVVGGWPAAAGQVPAAGHNQQQATGGWNVAALMQQLQMQQQQLQQQQQAQTTPAPTTTTPAPTTTTPKPKRKIPIRPDPKTRDYVRNMFLSNMAPGIDPLSILVGFTPETLMKAGINPLIANSGDISQIVPAVERTLGISLQPQIVGPGGRVRPGGMNGRGARMGRLRGGGGAGPPGPSTSGSHRDRSEARRQFMLQQRMVNEMMQVLGVGPEPLEPGDPGYRGPGATGARGAATAGRAGVGGRTGTAANPLEMTDAQQIAMEQRWAREQQRGGRRRGGGGFGGGGARMGGGAGGMGGGAGGMGMGVGGGQGSGGAGSSLTAQMEMLGL